MRTPIVIGLKEFKYKKDAIAHYRAILNSYDFGQSLNESDYDDLFYLYNYSCSDDIDKIENLQETTEDEYVNEYIYTETDELNVDGEILIDDIKVARVQFNTKCFEFFFSDNTSRYISYLMILNNQQYTSERSFIVACRNSIHKDIHSVKQGYFDNNSVKGQVKCQETGKLSKWEELVVDHRQPNTFSVIIDRFKEVNNIDLEEIEYSSNDQNQIIFKDESLSHKFVQYHKEKASLRVVRKECNSGRTGIARLKRSTKDLTVR